MTLVTATVEDIHGGPDNSVWIFHSLLREASDGTGIVSPRPVRVTPIAGVLSITLDPGFSAVAYRGKEYVIEVPATGTVDLWDLIAASAAFPPGTPPTLVAAAVMGYLAAHPLTGADISDSGPTGRAVLTSDTQVEARAAIGFPIVTPEDFGAVGNGTTDDATALRNMFLSASVNGGVNILIPKGKVYASSLPMDIKSNTFVFGSGTLKCLATHAAGMFIQYKNAIKNVTWIGPVVDINGFENMNGHSIGDVPNTTDFISDIHIEGKVMRTRIMTGSGGESGNSIVGDGLPVLYAGGGKGLTVQFRARNVYCNIIAEDCDIAVSVEAAVSNTRHLENIVIHFQAKDCKRTAVFIGGSREGVSSIDSGSFMHAKYPGVTIRGHVWSGQDGLVTDPVNTTQLVPVVDDPNYLNAGVLTMNYASGIDVELSVATPNRCTLVRGMCAASTIKITNALMDNLQDVWDTRPLDTLTPAGTFMSDNVFEANVHAKTHYGVLVRPHRDAPSGSSVVQRTDIDIKMWCQDGVGAITQDDSGVTDSFGTSVAYRFRDMKASPVKDIVGMSSHNPKPQWALAASGGRVAAERESWHDGTREVAVFDAANGWQFPRAYYNEKPVIFGSGGTGRKWLHYDSASQVMRLAGSAPGAETSGQVIATQGAVAVTDGATTASVAAGISLLVTANTAPTIITNLTAGYTGQIVTIRFNDSNTTVEHGTTIKLKGAVSRTFPANATLTMASSSGAWYETGSSDPLVSATAATASSLAQRDSNANLTADNFIATAASTPTAAGTTTLTIADTQVQVFTGSTTQTVKLPTTSVTAGQTYTLINNSSGSLTVQSANTGAVITQLAGKIVAYTALIDTPTTAADWQVTAMTAASTAVAGTIAMRDPNGNLVAKSYIATATSTPTAAGTTTLTINSAQSQVFTGSTTQTVLLPTTSVVAGQSYTVVNNSSGSVTVQSSAAGAVATVLTNTLQLFIAQVSTPTTAAHWRAI